MDSRMKTGIQGKLTKYEIRQKALMDERSRNPFGRTYKRGLPSISTPEDKKPTVKDLIEADWGTKDQLKSGAELPMLESGLWPFKEGQLVHEDLKPVHYLVYVLFQLLQISQAVSEFEDCYEKYSAKARAEFERFTRQQAQRVKKRKTMKAIKPEQLLVAEEDMAELQETIWPWVNKWCIGSDRMLFLIQGLFTERISAPALGMRETDFWEDGRPSKKLVDFVAEEFGKDENEDLSSYFKALYNQTGKAGKADRAKARERLLDKEHDIHFERIRESTLIFEVWCWVRLTVNVPGVLKSVSEKRLAIEIGLLSKYRDAKESQKVPYQIQQDISQLVAPVDKALGYERLRGRGSRGRGDGRISALKLPNGMLAKVTFFRRGPRKV